MRTKAYLGAMAVLAALAAVAAATDFPLNTRTTIHTADRDDAVALMTTEDGFVKACGAFDRSVRMGKAGPISTGQFVRFLGEQARPWSNAETEKMRQVFAGAGERIAAAGFEVPFPPVVTIVKTSGREESDAAYCRGPAIFFSQAMANLPSARLEEIVVHELFHILSNGNGDLRERLYAVLGFRKCPAVELPEKVRDRLITNPDAFSNDWYVEIDCLGKRSAVLPLLVSPYRDYDPKSDDTIFDYMSFRLMPLEEKDGRFVPSMPDGKVVMYAMRTCPDYVKHIGRNSTYIPQPEEMLAENWVLLVYGRTAAPDPWILEGMRKVLAPEKAPARALAA